MLLVLSITALALGRVYSSLGIFLLLYFGAFAAYVVASFSSKVDVRGSDSCETAATVCSPMLTSRAQRMTTLTTETTRVGASTTTTSTHQAPATASTHR